MYDSRVREGGSLSAASIGHRGIEVDQRKTHSHHVIMADARAGPLIQPTWPHEILSSG